MILLLGYTDRKGVTQTVEQVHELFLSKLMYRPLKNRFIIYFLLKHLQLNNINKIYFQWKHFNDSLSLDSNQKIKICSQQKSTDFLL